MVAHGLFGRPEQWLADIMTAVEARRWDLSGVLLGLWSIICVRNVLEMAVAKNPVYEGLAAFVHYPLAYLAPFAGLVLVLAFWSRIPPIRVARLMLLAWLLTLLPPLLDWLGRSESGGEAIGYLHGDPSDLPWVWLHFFDPSASFVGTTTGIRVETLLAVLCGSAYIYFHSRKFWRAAGGAVSIYVVSLFFFSLPLLVLGGLRVFLPKLTWNDLFHGELFLYRAASSAPGDDIAILWLVPLLLVLGWLWSRLEIRYGKEERWIRGSLGPSPFPAASFLLVPIMLFGILAGFRLFLPPAKSVLMVAPFDIMAPLGAVLALTLGCASLVRFGERDSALLLLLLALCLLAALGRTFAVALLAGIGPLVFLSPSFFPSTSRRWLLLLILPISAVGACAAGFALVVGPEAVVRLPPELLLLPVGGALAYAVHTVWGELLPRHGWFGWIPVALILGAAGTALLGAAFGALLAVVAVAGGLLLSLLPGTSVERWALAALCGLLVLGGGYALLHHEERREVLRQRVSCVARLEVLKGLEYERKGKIELARGRFKRALECQENYVPALRALGLSWFKLGNRPLVARKWLEAALAQDPTSAQELNNLAAAEMHLERWAEALELLDRAREENPRHIDVLYNRARVLEALGQRETAIEAWEEYLRFARHRPELNKDVLEASKRLRKLRRRKE